MARFRFSIGVVVVAVVACVATSCSSDDTAASPDTSVAADTTVAPRPPAEIRVFVPPGTTEGFEGAWADVTAQGCARTDAGWVTSGTLVNPTEASVNYRVYTSFNDPTGGLRALLQTDVNDVAPGAEASWLNVTESADGVLSCVLRIERVNAG